MTSQIFTMAEAAAYFRKSRRWFQSFLRDNPDCYFMAGRSKLFDEADLQRIKSRLRDEHLDRHRRQIRFASRRGQFGTRTSGSALTELRELVNERSPSKRSEKSNVKSNVTSLPNPTRRR